MQNLMYNWYGEDELDRISIDIYKALSELPDGMGVQIVITAKENEDYE